MLVYKGPAYQFRQVRILTNQETVLRCMRKKIGFLLVATAAEWLLMCLLQPPRLTRIWSWPQAWSSGSGLRCACQIGTSVAAWKRDMDYNCFCKTATSIFSSEKMLGIEPGPAGWEA